MNSVAYLIVTHGSRDFQYQLAVKNLAHLIQRQFQFRQDTKESNHKNSFPLIETACLELASIPLSQAIINFAHQASLQNYQLITIIPLFLISGVHVQQDIPHEINQAKQNLPNKITIELMPHFGSYKELLPLLKKKFNQFPTEQKILLAHGSNFANGNKECEEIGKQLNIDVAYWSINPSLRAKITNFRDLGQKNIAIIPYFLFEGRITKAIASQVEELKKEYPDLNISLDSPLGADIEVANIIVQQLTTKHW